jgi:hypothetical protein
MFKLDLSVDETDPLSVFAPPRTAASRPRSLPQQCMEKVISVADTAPPGLREQARAFSKDIERLVAYYMRQAIRSDRTTVYNALTDAGHPQLADLIRRL